MTKTFLRISWLTLIAPVAVYVWFWIVRADYYFPGRYEDAFRAMVVAIAVAAPGCIVLLANLAYRLAQAVRRRRAA